MTWQQILKVKGKKFKLFKEAVLEWSEEQDVGETIGIETILEDLKGRYFDKLVADGMAPSAAGNHSKAKLEARRSYSVLSRMLNNIGWNKDTSKPRSTWTKEE